MSLVSEPLGTAVVVSRVAEPLGSAVVMPRVAEPLGTAMEGLVGNPAAVVTLMPSEGVGVLSARGWFELEGAIGPGAVARTL